MNIKFEVGTVFKIKGLDDEIAIYEMNPGVKPFEHTTFVYVVNRGTGQTTMTTLEALERADITIIIGEQSPVPILNLDPSRLSAIDDKRDIIIDDAIFGKSVRIMLSCLNASIIDIYTRDPANLSGTTGIRARKLEEAYEVLVKQWEDILKEDGVAEFKDVLAETKKKIKGGDPWTKKNSKKC